MSFVPDPRQQQAIEHLHGPMLVLAGAGTGKTTVLVHRIAYLIDSGIARPDEILAITYTDNAAAELRDRIAQLTTPLTAAALRAATFHAFCNRVLHEAGRSFGVLDRQDLYIYLRRRLPDLGLQYYTRAVNPGQFLDALLDFFDRCHDELVTADDYHRYVSSLGPGSELPRVLGSRQNAQLQPEEVLVRCREIAAVYGKVEAMLQAENFGTFGHMILRAVQILRRDPVTLARERARARFILIDEFQDANVAQIELAQLLAGEERNVFAVGDPDQAIYRFRGATSGAFDEFMRRFPGARGVVLNANRRSGEHILACAFAAIRRNPEINIALPDGGNFSRERLLSLREPRGPKLPPVEIVPCPGAKEAGHREEAADVADAIERLRSMPPSRSGKPRFGILYRNHGNRDEMVEQLAARQIPFVVKGINALETGEVRDLLACLIAMHDPSDSEALFRVSALPVFRLDGIRVRDALAAAGRGARFASLLAEVAGGPEVLAAVERARSLAASTQWEPCAAARIAIAEFALDSASIAVCALCSFIAAWKQKDVVREKTLGEFLNYIAWFPEAHGTIEVDTGSDAADLDTVRLMTAHAAKGLEFDHVFVLRVNWGSFPGNYAESLFGFAPALRKAPAPRDSSDLHREEERRLFYVALTRARDSLTVETRRGRGKTGAPTGFAREIMVSSGNTAASFWTSRDPRTKLALQAAALQPAGVGEWLLLPPSPRVARSLSATAIEGYRTCPLKLKLMRDWEIPGPVSAALQYGSIVHQVLKDYFDALRQGRSRALPEVLELFRSMMADTHFEEAHQRQLYRDQGERQLTEFVAWQSQLPPPDVRQTEATFAITIAGVTVTGRIDRIDNLGGNEVAIVDYKTGTAKKQEDADASLQLSLYAIAAQERWHLAPARLILHNLEDNSQLVTTRDAAALEEARACVEEAAAGIAAGDFEPRRGYHCRWCEYRRVCPATEQRLYTIARAAVVQ